MNLLSRIKRINWQSIVSRAASASRAHQLVLIPLGVGLQEALHAAEQGFGDFGFQADDLLTLVGVTGLAAAPVVQRLALGLPRDEATFLPSSSKGMPLATQPLSHR